MASRSAQSVRADADQAATEAANDAAADANAAATDAQNAADEAVDIANKAADTANKAAERHLQIIDNFTDDFGNQRLRIAVGDGLAPEEKTVTFLGETFNALIGINYPA